MALDLDRAFARAGLTTHEAALLQFVREHSWGRATRRKGKSAVWPDALAVRWNPAEIAKRMGEGRNRISEAKTSLVKSRILVESREGLTINKNAPDWIVPSGVNAGKPRLSTAAIAYAMAAWPEPEVSEIPDSECPEIRTGLSGNPDKSVRESGQKRPETRTLLSGNPDACLIDERTRGDSTRLEEEDSEESKQTRGPDQIGNLIDEILLPFEAPAVAPIRPEIKGPGKDSPEAVALELWATALGTDPGRMAYGFWAREQCAFSPASWARSILERKVVGIGNRPSVRVLTAIIAKWRERGEPEWAIGSPTVQGPFGVVSVPLSKAEARRQAFKAGFLAMQEKADAEIKAREAINGHG